MRWTLSSSNATNTSVGWEDKNILYVPGNEVVGNELGLNRGAPIGVDLQGDGHQVRLLERLLDLLLDLPQAQRLLVANLALQDDDRHAGFRLQKGGQPIHGTALTQLNERLISLAFWVWFLKICKKCISDDGDGISQDPVSTNCINFVVHFNSKQISFLSCSCEM